MPSLRELQASFFGALGARAADDTAPLHPALLAAIDGRGTLDSEARVDVYAQMYWMRIADALLEDFPRVAALVGGERFHALGRAYLACTPSRHPSLRQIGDRFADFLASRPASEVAPCVADLARLERARLDVFDAADASVLTIDDLRRLAPDDWAALRLPLVPAVTFLMLAWPVHEVWAAEEMPPPETWQPHATALRVWRGDEFRLYQTSMNAAERTAIEAVRGGATFGEVCAALAAVVGAEQAAEEAGALLLRWLDDRILAADPAA